MIPRSLMLSVAVAVGLLFPATSMAVRPGPNGKIAVAVQEGSASNIWVMNGDGSGAVRLTHGSIVNEDPGWSPDGTRIVFVSDRDGSREIYTMNADGSGVTRLTNEPTPKSDPAWSPDGTKIAFAIGLGSPFSGEGSIHVMSANGTQVKPLTAGSRDMHPDWSPDGTRIAFTRDLGLPLSGDGDLYVMNPDGTGVTKIVIGGEAAHEVEQEPAWSPDGQKIALARGALDINVVNPDGTGLTGLTGGFFNRDPVWSPDGTKIAFNRGVHFRSGVEDLYVMNADGTQVTRLTDLRPVLFGFDWGPGFAPRASIAPSRDPVLVGQPVTFDGSASSDPDGTIARYRWDLDGNGSFETDTGEISSAERSYPAAATVTVGLQVRDHDGNTDTMTRTLSVRSRAPHAFLALSPNPALTGQPVTFDGSASSDPDGAIVNYRWDLDGDGSFETDTGTRPTASRSYRRAATVAVGLRVTDNDGNTNEDAESIGAFGADALGARRLTILSRRILAETTLTFLNTRSGIRVRSLVVRKVPSGAQVGLRCRRGKRRACRPQVQDARALAARTLSFPRLRQRSLRAGTVLEIRVTKPDHVGKYIRYTIRRAGFGKVERCLEPGSRAPKTQCD